MQYKNLAVNPVSVVLQLVGAKWKILIIQELLKKEMRFVELKNKIGCTAKVLTNCLKELEEDGLVVMGRIRRPSSQSRILSYRYWIHIKTCN